MAANFDIALNESTLSRINALIVDDLKSQLISAKQANEQLQQELKNKDLVLEVYKSKLVLLEGRLKQLDPNAQYSRLESVSNGASNPSADQSGGPSPKPVLKAPLSVSFVNQPELSSPSTSKVVTPPPATATSTWGAPLPRSNGDAATSSIQSPLASYAAATSSLPPKPVIPQRRSSRMEQHIVTWALPQSYAAIVRTLATPSLESSMSFPTFPLSFFRQHFGIPMKKQGIISIVDATQGAPGAPPHDINATVACVNPAFSPWCPREPGDHGFAFMDITTEQAAGSSGHVLDTFVYVDKDKCRYLGQYKWSTVRSPSQAEWASLDETVKSELSVRTYNKARDAISSIPNPAHVRKLYDGGRMKVLCILLQCVGSSRSPLVDFLQQHLATA